MNENNSSESPSSCSNSLSNSDSFRTDTMSSSKSRGSKRKQRSSDRKRHKRKLAKQIIYEKKINRSRDITAVDSEQLMKTSLEASIETVGTQLRIQNNLKTFHYFPLYPIHVKRTLSKEILNPEHDFLKSLPFLDFSVPVVTEYTEKSRDFQKACYLRESQLNSINGMLESRELMSSEFRLKLRPDRRLHPPMKLVSSLLVPSSFSESRTQWDSNLKEFFGKNFSDKDASLFDPNSRLREENIVEVRSPASKPPPEEEEFGLLLGKELNDFQVDQYFD